MFCSHWGERDAGMGGQQVPALHRQLRGCSAQPVRSRPVPTLWVEMGLKPVANSSEPARELLLRAVWGLSGQQDLVSCKALGSSPTLLSLGSSSTCTHPSRVPEMLSVQLSLGTSMSRSLVKRALRTFWKQFVSATRSMWFLGQWFSHHVPWDPGPHPGCSREAEGQDLRLPDPRPLSRVPLISLLGF